MLFERIETRVLKAKDDEACLNKLIAAHRGFINNCMIEHQKASGAPCEDETTVAMLAFMEAVKQYDLSKGKFLSFARLVINRRMIDAYRQQLKQKPPGTVSLDDVSEATGFYMKDYEAKAAIEACEQTMRRSELQAEIAEFELLLNTYALDFQTLVAESPKQEGLRDIYRQTAKWLAAQPELMRRLEQTKKLPAGDILKGVPIDKKRLDRGRKYIIALALLWQSDLMLIKAYLERR